MRVEVVTKGILFIYLDIIFKNVNITFICNMEASRGSKYAEVCQQLFSGAVC